MPLPLPTLPAPGSIDRRRKFAEALLAQGVQFGPVAHPLQGAARMANALVGAIGMRRADKEERQGREAGRAGTQALMESLLNSGVAMPQPPMTGSPAGGSMAAAGHMQPTAAPGQTGMDRKAMMGALTNEWIDPSVRTAALGHLMQKPEYGFMDVNGTVLRTNKADGSVDPIYTPEPLPDFEAEQGVRKEIAGVQSVKDYGEVERAYRTIGASVQNPSAAGDLSLIFNYMKMLDPGSVVRESEFATVAASGSYGERIKGMVEQIMSGKRLSDDVRRDFIDRANKIYGSSRERVEMELKRYGDIAGAQNLDPSRVLPQLPPSQPIPLPSGGSLTPQEDGSLLWNP